MKWSNNIPLPHMKILLTHPLWCLCNSIMKLCMTRWSSEGQGGSQGSGFSITFCIPSYFQTPCKLKLGKHYFFF